MFRLILWLRRLARALWLRVALFAVLAILAVAASHMAAPLVPDWIDERIDAGSVLPILELIASSMLAVSTFSLGVMVQSHRSAQQTATPRVLALMIADPLTQTVLGVFIGAFVYALTALILVQAGFDRGAAVIMGVTLAVIGAVVVSLIRWIAHLATLGTMADALDRAESQAREALTAHRKAPALGASPLTAETVIPERVRRLDATESGILQVIDVKGLASAAGGPVWVLRRPGQTVLKGMPVLQTTADAETPLDRHIVIGPARTFEQDPVFALTVLSEIAVRALSPAVNDPGTAREVVARLERLLWDWAAAEPESQPRHPQVFVAPWTAAELIEAAFAPIARDGVGMFEVARPLIEALDTLGEAQDEGLAEAASALAARAREHAAVTLLPEAERARLPG